MSRPEGDRFGGGIRIQRARRPIERMRGLLFRPRDYWLGTWLVLERTHAIHTLFMRYSIDVAFCDSYGLVLDVRRCVKPGRIWIGYKGAAFVLERAAGGSGEPWPSIGERVEIQ